MISNEADLGTAPFVSAWFILHGRSLLPMKSSFIPLFWDVSICFHCQFMQRPRVATADQVPFFAALSAELPNYFLFAFWARFLTSAACHPSEERSRVGVTCFALLLRWSDGRSCEQDVVLAKATAVLLMLLVALVAETGGRGDGCMAFLSSRTSPMAASSQSPLFLPLCA